MTAERLIIDYVNDQDDNLSRMARDIWDHPQIALQETYASKLQATELEADGFSVEWGTGGMDTAFVATWGSGDPIIGFLGEYDALPGPVADGFRGTGSHRTGRTRPRLRPQSLRHGVPGFGKGPEARDGTGRYRRHDPVLRLSRGRAGGGQGPHGERRRLRRPRRRHHLASGRNEPGLERFVARAQLLQGELPTAWPPMSPPCRTRDAAPSTA